MKKTTATSEDLYGYFWLPDDPEEEIAGVLRYDPENSIELNLFGIFGGYRRFGGEPRSVDIIHGIVDRKYLTLCNCHETSKSLSTPGFWKSTYDIGYFVEGYCFKRISDIRFDKFNLEYDGLEEWLALEGFEETGLAFTRINLGDFSLRYDLLPEITFAIDGFEISFQIDYSYEISKFHSRTFEQRTIVRVETSTLVLYELFAKAFLKHLESFLTLLMQRTIRPRKILASSPRLINWKEPTDVLNGREQNVRFCHLYTSQSDNSKPIKAQDFLCGYADLKSALDDCLCNWITKSELLEPVYDLYIGHVYHPQLPSHYSLLNLTQALESFHRLTNSETRIPKMQYETKKDFLLGVLPAALDKDFKKLLKDQLRYANELRLRERLRKLILDSQPVSSYCIPNANRFVARVTRYRNYFTHYDPALGRPNKYTEELFRTVQQLKFLVEVTFLFHLGLESSKIDSIVKQNENYSFLRTQIIKLGL